MEIALKKEKSKEREREREKEKNGVESLKKARKKVLTNERNTNKQTNRKKERKKEKQEKSSNKNQTVMNESHASLCCKSNVQQKEGEKKRKVIVLHKEHQNFTEVPHRENKKACARFSRIDQRSSITGIVA